MNDADWKPFEERYDTIAHELRLFMKNIDDFFGSHPALRKSHAEKIHSTKRRLKDKSHLREKIDRKVASGRIITPDNMFKNITDLAGVRLLLLFQADFSDIDGIIRAKINSGDWVLEERAKAYTWDPESAEFFQKFDLDVVTKDTSYTSVHYVIRPRPDSPLCCELQVRTLFEEIWGEVDHRINYPHPTDLVACREQIRVLSKIVGAGSRLVDSIQRSLETT